MTNGLKPFIVGSGSKLTILFIDYHKDKPRMVARIAKTPEKSKELIYSFQFHKKLFRKCPKRFPRPVGKFKIGGIHVFVEEGIQGRRIRPNKKYYVRDFNEFMNFLKEVSGLFKISKKRLQELENLFKIFMEKFSQNFSTQQIKTIEESVKYLLCDTAVFTGGDATYANFIDTPAGWKKIDLDLFGGAPRLLTIINFLSSYHSFLDKGRDIRIEHYFVDSLPPQIWEILFSISCLSRGSRQ